MKVSVKWLRDYVDVSMPVKDLADRLTIAGLEVSEVEIIGGDWENITIAKIVGVAPHPNADRLKLATVDLGGRQSTVVCGAPNLNVGDKIVFAHVGARLIDGHSGELIQLKPAKIRGVLSEGMICSEKEVGISDSHGGIMVLLPDATVGVPLAEYLGDTILDIDVTPNRPDCLSIVGIAREIAALTRSKFQLPEVCYDELEGDIKSFASVQIVEPELCPRYCASLLTEVKIGQSPQWLQQRLLSCGMRPISNVVDVTNYVMLEYGQPLHAFDFAKLRGGQIIVRRGKEGEIITTLDGVEHILKPDVLVIADKVSAVAVAGIMGGAATEVTDNTTTVLLESANFNRTIVHEGSVGLKLSSEASSRFEKGISPELALVALKRATQLMMELANAKVASGIIDAYPGKRQREQIPLSTGEVKRLLGIEVVPSKMVEALELLGFACSSTESPALVKVDVPWWRTDISCAADLVEEVACVLGYDNIPATMLSGPLPSCELVPILSLREKLRSILVSCGFQEVLTYSLTSMDMMKRLSPQLNLIGTEPLKVTNPMSRDLEYLRTTLRAGILTILARNQRYQQKSLRLIELGKVFLPRPGDLPQEKEMLCAVLCGLQDEMFWRGRAEPVDFFTAKGVVEMLSSRLGLMVEFLPGDDESLCPGKSAYVVAGKERLGVIGELHPRVTAAFDISETAFIVELDIDKLLSLISSTYLYQPIPRYPSVTRDMALVLDESITYQQVYNVISNFPLITQVGLFDLYRGEQIPAGKKSLAFRLVYQSSTHTLSDEDVDEVQRLILDRLASELGVTLRA